MYNIVRIYYLILEKDTLRKKALNIYLTEEVF